MTIQEKRNLAKLRIVSRQNRNKTLVNKNRQPTKILVGDIVLITKKNLKTQKSGKLEDRWAGPYKVVAISDNQMNCKVRLLQSGLEKIVNITEVKKYYDRRSFAPVQTVRNTTYGAMQQVLYEKRKVPKTILIGLPTSSQINTDDDRCLPKVEQKKEDLPNVKFKT